MDSEQILTICVPVFNVEQYLEECLESLVVEEYKQYYRVEIVSDCGSDSSLEIANKYQSQYPDIFKVREQPKNLKVSAARNLVLDHCNTEYVMFVDADDYVANDSIEKIIKLLKEEKPELLIFDYIRVYPEESVKVRLNGLEHGALEPSSYDSLFHKGLPVTPWAKVFKTEAFDLYRFRFNTPFQDLALIPAIICNLEKIIYLDTDYYYRHEREGSAMFLYELNFRRILTALNELALNSLTCKRKQVVASIVFKNMVDNVKRFKKAGQNKELYGFVAEVTGLLNLHFPGWSNYMLNKRYISSPKKYLFFKPWLVFHLLNYNFGRKLIVDFVF